MNLKKYLLIALGFLCLILGVIGAYLPVMPSFPFLMLASICFVKSSKRLDAWFKKTKVYREVVEPYMNKQGLTRRVRIQMSLSCIAFFSISIYLSRSVPHLQYMLIFLAVAHVVFFMFIAKKREKVEAEQKALLEKQLEQ